MKKASALLMLGCILLVVGLIAFFYREDLNPGGNYIMYDYPYQGLSLIFIGPGIGIIFSAILLGKTNFFESSKD